MKRIDRCGLVEFLNQTLSKRIDQNAVELWSKSFWDIVKRGESRGKSTFTMMLPPPNITGNLHLGHALTGAVQDAFIRHRKMNGYNVQWIPGFDHAGLATQSIVEKVLFLRHKKTRHQLARNELIAAADEWKNIKQSQMRDQLDRLGLDLTYDKEYFTMDEKSSASVREAFKKLFKSGLIYRADRPVYWSEALESTLSDIEVDMKDGKAVYARTGEIVSRKSIPHWFIDTSEMAHRAVEVVKTKALNVIPPNYINSWSSWLLDNGVKDWCISRQNWWGHGIPAFRKASDVDAQGNWIIADSHQEAENLLGEAVIQDPDVLDTWFSSSLLPLTVSGWPDPVLFDENCTKGMFPLDIMETGFDILTYWVSKMVMISLALESKIPFKTVLLHGMICDSEGKKMSKSRGNVVDPLDLIDGASSKQLQERTMDLKCQGILDEEQVEFALENQKKLFPNGIPACGADGLRAYLLSHDILEEVVKVQMMQIEKIRRLTNKIWNIYRFTINVIEGSGFNKSEIRFVSRKSNYIQASEEDKKVISQLEYCVEMSRKSFHDSFQLHLCFNQLEIFFSEDLSSKYLTYAKPYLSKNPPDDSTLQKLQILVDCIVCSTKLMYPFMPHLTEFLYQKLRNVMNSDQCTIENFDNLNDLASQHISDMTGCGFRDSGSSLKKI